MRVACLQLGIQDRAPVETLAHVLSLLDRARGSELILLPELWPTGYFSFERYAAESESIDGPIVQALRQKAQELHAVLYAGSFVERDADRLYNTSLLIAADGTVTARYRKIHTFGYQSQERQLLTAGTEVVVGATPWGKAGLSICYDLRFPELYRAGIDQGAEMFLVAAAWPAARVETWRLLNRTRALENQAFVFACNGAGASGGVAIGGHSLVIDPWGTVLAEGGGDEELLTCEVDPAAVGKARQEFPALRDRTVR